MAGRKRAMIVCGNAYGFRATYVPLLRSLNGLFAVGACVLDYPERYDLEPVFAELRRGGAIESGVVVPNDRHRWRHHREAAAVAATLRRTPIDVLLVDADFPPLQQYLIGAARTCGVSIVGVQKEVPTDFLGRYHAEVEARTANSEPIYPPCSGGSRARRVIGRIVRGPRRLATAGQLARYLKGTAVDVVQRTVNDRLLPWRFAGRAFPARRPDLSFVSTGSTSRSSTATS